ncbi:uncharacterized protein LOC142235490 [Haematobia irritans]|uniref:uncharacterized protein LOC142235490 n=1 Tax=Haematobia irritans TaxID=7368 RepID=UPI003F50C7D6
MSKGQKSSQRYSDLFKSRENLINSLIRNKNYIFENHASLTNPELEARMSLIESLFSQICNVQTSLEQSSVEEEEDDKRQRFEEVYCQVKSKILYAISQIRRRSANGNDQNTFDQTINSSVALGSRSSNLPKLKLPIFSGKYTEWTNWHNTFRSMVDSDGDLDDLSKFVHLRSCLGTIPLGTIEYLELTGENYPKALGSLRKRFENKSVIFQSHVKEIFDLERISQPSSISLRRLIDAVNSHLHSLESLGSIEELKDVLIFYLVRLKLDEDTLSKWHEDSNVMELPSWKNLETFLIGRCHSLENCEYNSNDNSVRGNKNSHIKNVKRNPHGKVLSVAIAHTRQQCPACEESHQLSHCQKFLTLSPKQRYFEAKKNSICILCLEKKHPVRDCKAPMCESCNRPHHNLLHRDNLKSDKSKTGDIEMGKRMEGSVLYSSMLAVSTMNFLATARILVRDVNGGFHETRCVLDSGSQLNIITRDIAIQLGLPFIPTSMVVGGIGQNETNIIEKVSTIIRSRVTNFSCNLELHVMQDITSYSPNCSVETDHWNLPNNIKLADPLFNKAGRVDVLLGVSLFFRLLSVGQIKLATEEKKCEEYFLATLKRTISGRFIVQLPFRDEGCSLGKSYEIALRRFLHLERRLEASPELKEQYTSFINEYSALGHLEVLQPNASSPKYFMPHHPVVRLESQTTKLRVVFDASCKSTNGKSLNDNLLVGCRLQPELFDILLRFRFYKYALTGDICKMYRQVLVSEADCDYQCILWRENRDGDIRILRLKTVTYGTSSAPFLAVRCLNYLAEHNKDNYPLGSRAILETFYMDDMLAGAYSITELHSLRSEISNLLKSGKFELHKWRSNCIELNAMDDSLNIKTGEFTKTLGVLWNSQRDEFSFSYSELDTSKVTKRTVLSALSRLFDPLGLINPVIVLGKIFMQQLWLLKLDWDESLPQLESSRWRKFQRDLTTLNQFHFPRTFWGNSDMTSLELHGFSDASNLAYGAVVYARMTDECGNINVQLMTAKSRVAPLKSLSIPRLELLGACLLVELLDRVNKCSSIRINSIFHWTDSSIVLHWISSHPNRWATFISNRVAKIQSMTSVSDWFKVNGKDNPADIVSRGMYPSELMESQLWFKGPSFLWRHRDSWPEPGVTKLEVTAEMEERRYAISLIGEYKAVGYVDLTVACKFSNSFLKLQRVFAYIFRWRRSIISGVKGSRDSYLSVSELKGGLHYLAFNIQNVHFAKEIYSLKNN